MFRSLKKRMSTHLDCIMFRRGQHGLRQEKPTLEPGDWDSLLKAEPWETLVFVQTGVADRETTTDTQTRPTLSIHKVTRSTSEAFLCGMFSSGTPLTLQKQPVSWTKSPELSLGMCECFLLSVCDPVMTRFRVSATMTWSWVWPCNYLVLRMTCDDQVQGVTLRGPGPGCHSAMTWCTVSPCKDLVKGVTLRGPSSG